MNFSTKLRNLLKDRGLTQGNLADLLEISPSQVSDWIRDKTMPSVASGLKLARVLSVTMDYLFDDSLEQPPKPELTTEERTLLAVIRRLGAAEVIFRLTMGVSGANWATAGTTPGPGGPSAGPPGSKATEQPGE